MTAEPPDEQRRSRIRMPQLPGVGGIHPDGLIIDEVSEQFDRTRRILTQSPEDAAEAVLAKLGPEAEAEARIAAGLEDRTPLAYPEAFPEAHRAAIHALEILDREGSREPKVPRLGPLTAVAETLVEFVADYLVKSYASDVVGRLRKQYAVREAQCEPGTPERRMLARARIEVEHVSPGFGGGWAGAPVLIVGGLALPVLASLSNQLGAIDFTNRRIMLGGLFALFLLAIGLSSAMVRGAAVARRRSRMIMQDSLEDLWAAMGNAGNPPEDDSVQFASIAVLVTALLWFVVPAAAAVIFVVL